MPNIRALLGECYEIMSDMPGHSFSSCVTDPHYGTEFMDEHWGFDFPGVKYWGEIHRLLLPGSFLMAFCGTRRSHRLACAIEDAGFEIRDSIAWIYNKGNPKSHNVGRRGREADPTFPEIWDEWGTKLRPMHEPIIVAMKPREGTYYNNAEKYGVSGLWIEGNRIDLRPGEKKVQLTWDDGAHPFIAGSGNAYTSRETDEGRWPPNVAMAKDIGEVLDRRMDGVSRFYYCPKVNIPERNLGLEGEVNTHPTVKPLDLMRWLCRLTKTPYGAKVLDPFMGSGSTGMACALEGFDFLGIEIRRKWFDIAVQRIWWAEREAERPQQLRLGEEDG